MSGRWICAPARGRAWQGDGSFHEGLWENNVALGPGTRRLLSGIEISGFWTGDTVAAGLIELPSGAQYAGPMFDSKPARVEPELLRWLETRLSSRDPDVLLLYGNAYTDFEEPPPDPELARRAFEQSARLGSAQAAYRLARLIGAFSPDESIQWLTRAADQDHPSAAARLAEHYHQGTRVPRDFDRALHYYEVAVGAGDTQSRNNLAWLLATCPDAAVRDGDRALALIAPLAGFMQNWQYLETLAAAYAQTGNFSAAEHAQIRALELLNPEEPLAESTRADLEAHLESYRLRKPVRDTDSDPMRGAARTIDDPARRG